MLKGPLSRTRSSQKKYARHIKNKKNVCEFCKFSNKHDQVSQTLDHFWIVNNIFGYDVWDSCGVSDHLMIVPKRHLHLLESFNNAETLEYINTLKQFEKSGYSTYFRSPDNVSRSVVHHHTHFIKLDNKRKKALLFLHKPHLMVYK